jgi:hypothetical protein
VMAPNSFLYIFLEDPELVLNSAFMGSGWSF